MTTANPEQARRRAPRPARSSWYAALREALDRPLTSYYLLLGASALLLTIGLIMVLSASSVYSFEQNDGDSYAIVKRQLMWVAIGLPAAWLASRLSQRLHPAHGVAGLRRLAGAAAPHRQVRRRSSTATGTGWPSARSRSSPSEIAKLALILWAAHVYAHKDRRLGDLHQVLMPVVPGMLLATGLVVVGRDLGTALVLFAILLGMLWVVGAPARFFVVCISVVSVAAIFLASTSPERLARITNFADPFKDYHDTGLAAGARPLRAVHRRLVRAGDRRQPAEVGRPARGPHRLHLRGAGRGARARRHPPGDRALPHHRVRRAPGRA